MSDSGTHSHSATATLNVTVVDVNDNPPFISHLEVIRDVDREPIKVFSSPTNNYNLRKTNQIVIKENESPRKVATFTIDDPDEWQLGHGGPFKIQIDSNASNDIKSLFSIVQESGKVQIDGLCYLRVCMYRNMIKIKLFLYQFVKG